MPDTDEGRPEPAGKREYIKPRLERLGTIRELTRGLGKDNLLDGEHPPGQNKSRI